LELSQFQRMMHRIYFHRDRRRGLMPTYMWLLEEVSELGKALVEGDREAVEAEFADVAAWLSSLANVAQVDLEKAALSKYNGRCPRCGAEVCRCPFR
jgi:NTP pyrophosphatase (non-canonical NTP hydrolase)